MSEFEDPEIDFVAMPKDVYDKLKKEATFGRRENMGMLFGAYRGTHIEVIGFERFPKKWAEEYKKTMPFWKRILGTPYGGKLASDRVNDKASQRENVIGFYHSHPYEGSLSPDDKREIREAKKFKYLAYPSALHILAQRRSMIKVFLVLGLLPLANIILMVTGLYNPPLLVTLSIFLGFLFFGILSYLGVFGHANPRAYVRSGDKVERIPIRVVEK